VSRSWSVGGVVDGGGGGGGGGGGAAAAAAGGAGRTRLSRLRWKIAFRRGDADALPYLLLMMMSSRYIFV
jgi:hypothetical protein